jgi:hypothetical protein
MRLAQILGVAHVTLPSLVMPNKGGAKETER